MRAHSRNRWMVLAVTAVALSAVSGCKSAPADKAPDQPVAAPAPAPGFTQQVALSGANEVPPVDTPAAATGSITVNADHTISARIVATGMVATVAHIHLGAPGTNGPVIVPLTATADNTFIAAGTPRFTAEQYAAFKAGNTYVNIHSDAHKPGEIRAQLKGG